MELLYIWIYEYININQCGFSFSSRVRITQQNGIEKKKINLIVEDNVNYIENFFGSNITDVTAIIGGNGVGKSNLLDFLATFITNKGFYEDKWLVIFYDKKINKIKISHSLFEYDKKNIRETKYLDQWEVSVNNNSQYKIDGIEKANVGYNFVPVKHRVGKTVPELKAKVIFYSPFLDLREYPSITNFEQNFINVSTNYLIDSDSRNEPTERDKIEIHKYRNIERQFLFVQNNLPLLKDINFPTEIEVRFTKSMTNDNIRKDDQGFAAKEFYEKFRDSATKKWNNGPNRIIHEGKEKRLNKLIEKGRKLKYKWWFSINLVTNFLYNFSHKVDLHDIYFKVDYDLKEFDFEHNDPIALAKLFFEKQTYIKKKSFDFILFIDLVNNIIDSKADVMYSFEENESYFYVPSDVGKEIWEMHNKYLRCFNDPSISSNRRGFLDINWRDISSGEKAFLDLFSRLYYGLNQLRETNKKYEIIYILLDEAEVGFHPKWQKDYLSKIIDYLSSFEQYRFHVILTTHSPFIASDLPSDNLILLKKGANNNCVVQERLFSLTETFGANIHNLLADTFFMEDGLMGNFAHKKITEIIKYDSSLTIENKSYIKKVINLIGEPLLRIKLKQLYAERLGDNYEEEMINEEIEILQKRLLEIKEDKN